ncbi:NAD(P)H-dependent oxidoreductase [Tistrella mobilis]|uniref:FMN-dependent NADH-azoreductase n=1 Tax=Tistrella mobilis TaxID=171437 RepID=UPI0031F654C7
MIRLLQIDASARPGRSGTDPHGSHTRRLTARFADRWRQHRPDDEIICRDVGLAPPAPVDADWVRAAFTRPEARDDAMQARLAESDRLTAELLAADIVVFGAPMYNFGLPSALKAWIDNIVRVGVTFGFDRARGDAPYWPMLPAGRRAVVLTARGDLGYGPGGIQAHNELVVPGLAAPLRYIGMGAVDVVAIEGDEFGDDRLAASIAAAEAAVDRLVDRLTVGGAAR